jgi:hypothetical protein
LEYTVNFNGNADIDLDRFVITGGANSGSASTKFELRWSVDNYATNLGFFTLPNCSYTLTSVNLSSLNNFTGNQIKFRVYRRTRLDDCGCRKNACASNEKFEDIHLYLLELCMVWARERPSIF